MVDFANGHAEFVGGETLFEHELFFRVEGDWWLLLGGVAVGGGS